MTKFLVASLLLIASNPCSSVQQLDKEMMDPELTRFSIAVPAQITGMLKQSQEILRTVEDTVKNLPRLLARSEIFPRIALAGVGSAFAIGGYHLMIKGYGNFKQVYYPKKKRHETIEEFKSPERKKSYRNCGILDLCVGSLSLSIAYMCIFRPGTLITHLSD